MIDLSGILEEVRRIHGWLSDAEAKLLAEWLQQVSLHTETTCVVEIGSLEGKSALLLARTMRSAGIAGKIFAIDPHNGDLTDPYGMPRKVPSTWWKFQDNIIEAGMESLVQPVRAPAQSVKWTDPIDLLYIDGLHDYDNVRGDFEHYYPHLRTEAVVALHDYCREYPGVFAFVNEVIAAQQVELVATADTLVALKKR